MDMTELRKKVGAENNDPLPARTELGGYPLVYYTESRLEICAKCANDTDTSDPVVDADVYYEGPPKICDDKGEIIESAYGDPDAE